jgi:hypothetical protein
MRLRRILVGIGLLVVTAAWYAFRPERLFLDRYVNEPLDAATVDDHQAELVGRGLLPPPIFTALRTGRFRSGAHETEGVATVHDLGGGRRVLRLTAFRTSNGPDVHVYLVAAPVVADDENVKRADVVDLGALKGNIGDQNYEVPERVDLARYQSVSIWCKRFGVGFGSASLRKS